MSQLETFLGGSIVVVAPRIATGKSKAQSRLVADVEHRQPGPPGGGGGGEATFTKVARIFAPKIAGRVWLLCNADEEEPGRADLRAMRASQVVDRMPC